MCIRDSSSLHRAGRRASVVLQSARQTLAALLNARPSEIIFTSGGTESDNAAVRGIALARRAATGANRLITTAVEHKAVLQTAEDLRDHFGFSLTVLPVDRDGVVSLASVAAALGDAGDVALVSVMYANNEIGAVEPAVSYTHLDVYKRQDIRRFGVNAAAYTRKERNAAGAKAKAGQEADLGDKVGAGEDEEPVSYTHLDVYKRQDQQAGQHGRRQNVERLDAGRVHVRREQRQRGQHG